jgi:hypothetical protein
MAAPSPAPLPIATPGSDNVVQGFANGVPLAVALREVLPSGYGYSIDQDVDLGTQVSFEGGKPWRETLHEMLQPVGLTVHEQEKMVSISRQANAAMSPVPMDTMAPSAPAAAPMPQPMVQTKPAWADAHPGGARPAIMQPPAMPITPSAPPPTVITTARSGANSVVDTWTASRSDTLRKVLEDWSRRAGVEFEWSAEYDYPLQASISYTGTFEEAVRSLLSGFEEANPQPVAQLHANPNAGQMVLVVETRGNSYAD